MNAKLALLAPFAAAACVTATPAFADAMDTWVEHRNAHGLPVTATPSDPAVPNDWLVLELSLSEGSADRAGLVRAMLLSGNGNGHGDGDGGDDGQANGDDKAGSAKYACPADLLREMSRTDGNPHGDDWSCNFRAP